MERILVVCPACHKQLRLSDRANLGLIGRCPECEHRFELREAGNAPSSTPPPAPKPRPSRGIPLPETAPPSPAPAGAQPLPEAEDIQVSITASPRMTRAPSKKRGVTGLLVGISMIVSVGLIVWVVLARPSIVLNRGQVAPPHSVAPPEKIENAPPAIQTATPAGPIRLNSLPGGVRLIAFLRPRELWHAGAVPHELWECSGPLGTWSRKSIREQAFANPDEIDELLFGWILGPAGTVPQLAIRVRPVPVVTREVLAQRLGPSFIPGTENVWRTSPDRAVVWTTEGDYVIVPTELADEVPQASSTPLPTDRGIEELLSQTSRSSLLTLLAIPLDLEIHGESLFAPAIQSLLRWSGEFLSQKKKCEAVAIAANWTPEASSLQIRMRANTGARMADFQRSVEESWRETPGRLQGMMSSLQLAEGAQPLARRFPTMLRDVQQNLKTEIAGRDLAGQAALPERAWPNLLTAGVLSFYGLAPAAPAAVPGKTPPKETPPAEKSLNLSIPDRLRLRVDVDFRDVPLEDALDDIAQEIGCALEIDGNALKMAGYTRNMPQRMRAEQKQAGEVLREILSRYTEKDAMVLALEKPEGPIWVTTQSVATAKKWQILSLATDKPTSEKSTTDKPASDTPQE